MRFIFAALVDVVDAPEFAGTLRVVAESAQEVAEVVRHCGYFGQAPLQPMSTNPEDVLAYAQALQAGTLEALAPVYKGWHWFEVDVCLPIEFTTPYVDALSRYTGFEDWSLNRIDLDPYLPPRLRFGSSVHVVTARIEDWILCFSGYAMSKTQEDAERRAVDHLSETVGMRKQEPEYLQNGNGTYSPNPRYTTGYRNAPQPALGAEWLWNALASYWFEQHATARQREVVEASRALGAHSDALKCSAGYPTFSAPYSVYYLDPSGTIDYDGKGKMASHVRTLAEVR